MTAAAFRATYSDWKVIKGRKVVQVVFELPLEQADQAYQVLGGMPIAAHEIWCGIAKLASSAVEQGTLNAQVAGSNPASSARRKFSDLPPAQQAAMRCNEPVFWAFLREIYLYEPGSADDAAEAVRERCNVGSRSEIRPGTEAERKWREINDRFEAWKIAEGAAA